MPWSMPIKYRLAVYAWVSRKRGRSEAGIRRGRSSQTSYNYSGWNNVNKGNAFWIFNICIRRDLARLFLPVGSDHLFCRVHGRSGSNITDRKTKMSFLMQKVPASGSIIYSSASSSFFMDATQVKKKIHYEMCIRSCLVKITWQRLSSFPPHGGNIIRKLFLGLKPCYK